MKFVETKTAEQLDLQALHRVRERLVSQPLKALAHASSREHWKTISEGRLLCPTDRAGSLAVSPPPLQI